MKVLISPGVRERQDSSERPGARAPALTTLEIIENKSNFVEWENQDSHPKFFRILGKAKAQAFVVTRSEI